jgi:hypothetical protein
MKLLNTKEYRVHMMMSCINVSILQKPTSQPPFRFFKNQLSYLISPLQTLFEEILFSIFSDGYMQDAFSGSRGGPAHEAA